MNTHTRTDGYAPPRSGQVGSRSSTTTTTSGLLSKSPARLLSCDAQAKFPGEKGSDNGPRHVVVHTQWPLTMTINLRRPATVLAAADEANDAENDVSEEESESDLAYPGENAGDKDMPAYPQSSGCLKPLAAVPEAAAQTTTDGESESAFCFSAGEASLDGEVTLLG